MDLWSDKPSHKVGSYITIKPKEQVSWYNHSPWIVELYKTYEGKILQVELHNGIPAIVDASGWIHAHLEDWNLSTNVQYEDAMEGLP